MNQVYYSKTKSGLWFINERDGKLRISGADRLCKEDVLYLFCEQDEGPGPIPMMLLVVFDVSGGRLTRVGEMNAAPGYIPDGIYRVPTDPKDFYLDDFDSMAQDMMVFAVGPKGLPEQK